MPRSRVFAASTVGLGALALAHALLTWPPAATLALFLGGALVAFVAEAAVVGLGFLEHHIGPKLLGVPIYILFGWTGAIYVTFRIALILTDGWQAVLLAAAIATTYDLLTDHQGVDDGHWTYTDSIPGPRLRAVPWWNFVGWFVISAITASLALPFL